LECRYGLSDYESFIKLGQNDDKLIEKLQMGKLKPSGINSISNLSGLFDTGQYKQKGFDKPITLSDGAGVTEYVNANFFTWDTIFAVYPHPSTADVGVLDGQGICRPGSPIAPALTYLCNRDADVHHLARVGVFPIFLLDDMCWSDYAEKLFPRAAGYSANVLQYFFRGKFRTQSTSTQDRFSVEIQNASSPTEDFSNGSLFVYAEDGSGNRTRVATQVVDRLKPGGTLNIGFSPTGTVERVVLVFQGQIGTETNAVAGKVVELLSIVGDI
jgi:hypothetical protein